MKKNDTIGNLFPWLLFLLLALQFPGNVFAEKDPCESLTGSEYNQCLHQSLLKADPALNQAYREAAGRFKNDPGKSATLKEAERYWIQWRDAHCKKDDEWCLLDMTRTRTGELQKIASGSIPLAAYPPFAQVKSLVCDKPMDPDDPAVTCGEFNFSIIHPIDLNGDGNPEWLYEVNNEECGAHAICQFAIIQEKGGQWRSLAIGHSSTLKTLRTRHGGYSDLIGWGGNSDCDGLYSPYVWDGETYRADKPIKCNSCPDNGGKPLPKICEHPKNSIAETLY